MTTGETSHSPDLVGAVARHGGRLDEFDGHSRWWMTNPEAAATEAAVALGYTESRRLFQMRRSLPLDALAAERAPVETRAFDPTRDVEAWLAINNAAFAWHPDQGNWTAAQLAERMTEPWFDLDDFRVADFDGAMAGFCWTKVHRDHDPLIGEIYVIAIDPHRIGTGLGSAMTRAGLDWLWEQRKTPTAMLYVEADNTAALATYRRLGFEVHLTDVAYEPAPSRPAAPQRPAAP